MDAINTGRLDRIHDLTTVLQGDPRQRARGQCGVTTGRRPDRYWGVRDELDTLYQVGARTPPQI
jgi:hypothetical protein